MYSSKVVSLCIWHYVNIFSYLASCLEFQGKVLTGDVKGQHIYDREAYLPSTQRRAVCQAFGERTIASDAPACVSFAPGGRGETDGPVSDWPPRGAEEEIVFFFFFFFFKAREAETPRNLATSRRGGESTPRHATPRPRLHSAARLSRVARRVRNGAREAEVAGLSPRHSGAAGPSSKVLKLLD